MTGTVASEQQMAAMDFEPWQHSPGEKPLLPTPDQWQSYQVVANIAWAMLHKSKPELMKLLAEMDEENGQTMADGFISTIDHLKGVLTIIEAAEARIL